MFVNDGVECQTVSPGRGEVPDVDVMVSGSLHLAPEQQGVLGRSGGSSWSWFFNGDLLDLESQDDGPNETWKRLELVKVNLHVECWLNTQRV